MAKITGSLSGTHMCIIFCDLFIFVVTPCAPIGHTSWASMSIYRGPVNPGGIEPQPIKLEFTIYPAELWIYFRRSKVTACTYMPTPATRYAWRPLAAPEAD